MSDQEDCKCPAPEPGIPKWMPTFADLMTLLMCFFVLLLSFSNMDVMKFKQLAGSMANAFGVQDRLKVMEIPKGTSVIAQQFSPGKPDPTPINEIYQHSDELTEISLEVECSAEYKESEESGAQADLESDGDSKGGAEQDSAGTSESRQRIEELIAQTRQDATDLATELQEQIARGEVEVETQNRKIVVRIREKGSFSSGSASLVGEYRGVLHKLRDVLTSKPGRIMVQGHTDNIPIATPRFRSNWELSSARAVSVAHELLAGGVLNSRRFMVTGYGDIRPLVDNNSPENRAQNRRVEIVIQQGLDKEAQNDLRVLREEDPVFYDSLDLEIDGTQFSLKPSEIF